MPNTKKAPASDQDERDIAFLQRWIAARRKIEPGKALAKTLDKASKLP